MHARTFRIFWEKQLDEVLNDKIQAMKNEITQKTDDYILNVNETEFISYLLKKYSSETLDIKFDEVSASTHEANIPAEHFPGGGFLFNVTPGRSYLRDVIKYHIPVAGDTELLYCMPNPRTMRTTEVSIEDGCVCFEIVNFSDRAEKIKQEAEEAFSLMRGQLAYVKNQVSQYNASLKTRAAELFTIRKQHLLKKGDLLSALGVPLKKKESFPSTFAIPTPQTTKKIRVSPPEVTEKGYKPEPTLDSSVYQEILQVIHDVGKQFERMPSTYANKDEEALRDHILLVLEPRFEGSATGETFNKVGKTDVLLRYQGSNVFIAECKFWKGAKAFLDTITQLLGYLTWRDSKAAVVIFVQNKDFSSVISIVETEISKHSNYLGFVSKKEETWLNYRFHINGDPNREVKLAVLLFHIPPI